MKIFLLISGIFLLVFSCKKPVIEKEIPASDNKVLVLCEGNFQWGNARFDIYYPDKESITEDAYMLANGTALGDVLQSGKIINGELYLVLNNSGKVVVIDTANFKIKRSIKGLKSPRYIQEFNGHFILVSDIYSGDLKIIETGSGDIVKKIWTDGWNEEMIAVSSSEIAIFNQKGKVYFFNTTSLNITDSIAVNKGSQWGVSDKENYLWVMSSDTAGSALTKIDVLNKIVKKIYPFTKGNAVSKLAKNRNSDSIFYLLNNGVCVMGIHENAVNENAFYTVSTATFYGLGIHPVSGEIYVADAKDYISKGTVHIVDKKGKERSSFKTGYIPSGFIFINK